MSVLEVIEKKKRGQALDAQEIRETIEAYDQGEIQDYQMSALLMAIFFSGMNTVEINALTRAMIESGDTVDFSSIEGTIVDKHSTGGVGDTTTLVLGPLLAAYGLPFGKMSGRGLGHTGGTLDKLESIPGLSVDLSVEEIIRATNDIGMAVAGQTARITPADKKLYALRDATATVNSIPLIASSIMSKKLAIHGDCLLLDVKVGEGAFMKDEKSAYALAKTMVGIGESFNRKTAAILTRMDQPLGRAVGNALEVKEAIQTLRGEGPADLTELCVFFATKLILMARGGNEATIRSEIYDLIQTGAALEQFKRFVENQGGDSRVVDEPSRLAEAEQKTEVLAGKDGYVASIHAEAVGILARDLGAGRISMSDTLDMGAGIYLHKKCGEAVKRGDVLATLYGSKGKDMDEAKARYANLVEITDDAVSVSPLIIGEVTHGS